MANMARIKSEFLIFSGFFWFNPTKWRDYAWLLMTENSVDFLSNMTCGLNTARI